MENCKDQEKKKERNSVDRDSMGGEVVMDGIIMLRGTRCVGLTKKTHTHTRTHAETHTHTERARRLVCWS